MPKPSYIFVQHLQHSVLLLLPMTTTLYIHYHVLDTTSISISLSVALIFILVAPHAMIDMLLVCIVKVGYVQLIKFRYYTSMHFLDRTM